MQVVKIQFTLCINFNKFIRRSKVKKMLPPAAFFSKSDKTDSAKKHIPKATSYFGSINKNYAQIQNKGQKPKKRFKMFDPGRFRWISFYAAVYHFKGIFIDRFV